MVGIGPQNAPNRGFLYIPGIFTWSFLPPPPQTKKMCSSRNKCNKSWKFVMCQYESYIYIYLIFNIYSKNSRAKVSCWNFKAFPPTTKTPGPSPASVGSSKAQHLSQCDAVTLLRRLGFTLLGCPRRLGSSLDQWVISPTYKWGILGV